MHSIVCTLMIIKHTNLSISKFMHTHTWRNSLLWKFWNYERKVMMQQDIQEVCVCVWQGIFTWPLGLFMSEDILWFFCLQLYLFSTYIHTHTHQFHCFWKSTSFFPAFYCVNYYSANICRFVFIIVNVPKS